MSNAPYPKQPYPTAPAEVQIEVNDAPPQYEAASNMPLNYAQPQQYPPQQQPQYQPQQITIQTGMAPQPNITVVMSPRMGESPVQTVCHNCKANIFTQTKYESGIAAWLIAGGCCLFGLWCGCCLLPFCIDSCKDVEHYCPNCRALVGRYKRI